MRFLHTADWQIGMKANHVGEAANQVREERLFAAHRVIETAKAKGVDFILIAGDIFEDNAVERLLVQKTADILDRFEGPVYIIPGNHDPLTPGSVWEHPAWKSSQNVHLLCEELAVEIPGGLLYPCPVREKYSDRNPTTWIMPEKIGIIRIGIAHGTVEGIRQDEPDYPIPRDMAYRAGLDYLALGHWHSYTAYPGPDGLPCMAYSGTHEATSFGERDSGNVLLVNIPDAGAPAVITPIYTGSLTWTTISKELREPADLAQFKIELESMDKPDKTLVTIKLSGLLAAGDRAKLDHIEQILNSRFLYGRLDVTLLRPSPEDDSWIISLPPGIIREMANRLRAEAGTGGPSSEVATRALMELYAITTEALQ